MSEPKTLDDVIAERAAKKEALQKLADSQRAIDLEAIMALEDLHGDSNVAVLDIPYTPGLPTCVAVRTPKPIEFQRYRDMNTGKEAGPKKAIESAETLGKVCRIYPPKVEAGSVDAEGEAVQDLFPRILEARSGVLVGMGLAATKLIAAREEEDSKR